MESLTDRFKLIYTYSKLNKNQFAKKIGVSASLIGDILRDKKGTGAKIIEGISREFPEINTQWFISGEGEMIKGKSPPGSYEPITLTTPILNEPNTIKYNDMITDIKLLKNLVNSLSKRVDELEEKLKSTERLGGASRIKRQTG